MAKTPKSNLPTRRQIRQQLQPIRKNMQPTARLHAHNRRSRTVRDPMEHTRIIGVEHGHWTAQGNRVNRHVSQTSRFVATDQEQCRLRFHVPPAHDKGHRYFCSNSILLCRFSYSVFSYNPTVKSYIYPKSVHPHYCRS